MEPLPAHGGLPWRGWSTACEHCSTPDPGIGERDDLGANRRREHEQRRGEHEQRRGEHERVTGHGVA
ncbi:MAG: hypothetical protein R3B72_12815 [Polyangiaceae bacterium]